MARPKPTVLIESVDPKSYKAEQVLKADAIYAVFYKEDPINLRTLNTLISHPGPKYKKCNFSNPGGAVALARRLNSLFKTKDFVVRELIAGSIFTAKLSCEKLMLSEEYLQKLYADLRKNQDTFRYDTDDEINKKIFKNSVRPRLTDEGFEAIKDIYTVYEFEFDTSKLRGKHTILLSRKMIHPYYIDKDKFIFFGQEDAFFLKMFGGNVFEWLESSCK